MLAVLMAVPGLAGEGEGTKRFCLFLPLHVLLVFASVADILYCSTRYVFLSPTCCVFVFCARSYRFVFRRRSSLIKCPQRVLALFLFSHKAPLSLFLLLSRFFLCTVCTVYRYIYFLAE